MASTCERQLSSDVDIVPDGITDANLISYQCHHYNDVANALESPYSLSVI